MEKINRKICPVPVQNKLASASRRYICGETASVPTLFPQPDGTGKRAVVCLSHSVNVAVTKLCSAIMLAVQLKNQEECKNLNMSPQDSVDILKSETCFCGNEKDVRNAFCKHCYYRLTPAIRKALYQQIGFGFEQAYKLACDTLQGLNYETHRRK